MLSPFIAHPLLGHCTFVRTTTPTTFGFSSLVVLASLVTFAVISRRVEKGWLHFLTMGAGIAIFEIFTGPMWLNEHLGKWAYIYTDVSWILTIGWTSLILSIVLLVDRYLKNWSEIKRFIATLGILLIPTVVAEIAVVNMGIRSYSPEVESVVSGILIASVPIEILYYVPVFTTLVITFYKYWSLYLCEVPLLPMKKRKWIRALGLAFLAVFLFEILIEPMVENRNLPKWSYIYHDISVLMTLSWVLIIAIAAIIVQRVFLHLSRPQQFAAGVLVISALALPIEIWLMSNGYRVYGHSAVSNFTGYSIFLTEVPVEVAFAIPCYLSLIVAFIRYWEIVLDNQL